MHDIIILQFIKRKLQQKKNVCSRELIYSNDVEEGTYIYSG